MPTSKIHTFLPLAIAASLILAANAWAAAPATPEPCQVLTAEVWSSVMGYAAVSRPGELNCTYEGPGKSGAGQFRILSVVGSTEEAQAVVKRMHEHQSRGGHPQGSSVIDSHGPVVLSIALFEQAPTPSTPAQLKKLVEAVKLKLGK